MLTSLHNPLIKEIRKLRQGKVSELALLEGTNLIEAACLANCPLETVCYSQNWQEKNSKLWLSLSQLAQRLELVDLDILSSLATTVNPDGVIATIKKSQLVRAIPANLQLGLVLENIQDPGNLGTIMRTSLACSVDCLFLSKNCARFDQPKVLRSSVGACFQLACQSCEDLVATVKFYQAQGLQVVATTPVAQKLYWELDLRQPTLLLLGNEAAGLSQELIQIADHSVRLPLSPAVESLNVAITSAILLYERQRQQNS
jgi:RNA methyltransferase, TrmH family